MPSTYSAAYGFGFQRCPLDWEVFTRLDRSQYYVKRWAADERRTVVVDNCCLKTEAADTVQSWSLSFEEVYFLRKDLCLLVFHSSQTVLHAFHQYINFKTKRKLYWHYIPRMPSNLWRSGFQRAMTSSTAQILFPLKPSQDLANMLTSLEAKSRLDNAWGGEERGKVYSWGNSSRRADPEPDEKHDSELVYNASVQAPESAAQARYTLRMTLIAKVLAEKYTREVAADNYMDFVSYGSFLRYLRRLEEVRTTIPTDDQWREHILQLAKEWEQFNVVSAVLLS
ncbi:hypothetical protein C8J57DRAFT_1472164 [Mycena rebaudengoi]|nr:hypothetical protein C8J57DRAFT_1478510 [Mycena rebaudengoi]KAJ7258852.1 hypothetical protein C8J57DRAFT_1472164 [Mycena rebaudengoi]